MTQVILRGSLHVNQIGNQGIFAYFPNVPNWNFLGTFLIQYEPRGVSGAILVNKVTTYNNIMRINIFADNKSRISYVLVCDSCKPDWLPNTLNFNVRSEITIFAALNEMQKRYTGFFVQFM